MPADDRKAQLYILPSEALDADALASSLLFIELWQLIPQEAPSPREPQFIIDQHDQQYVELLALKQRYSKLRLHCLLPLTYRQREEILWRKDIAYLLNFIGQQLQQTTGRPEGQLSQLGKLETLQQIFSHALGDAELLQFTTHCPFNFAGPKPQSKPSDGKAAHNNNHHDDASPESSVILLDRHHLPDNWYREYGQQYRPALEARVVAIWDHRPDSHSLEKVPLRHIHRASSCVALLLNCAFHLGLVSQLSRACCLFAMATLHLDRQNLGHLLDWEEIIWRELIQRLTRPTPMADPPMAANAKSTNQSIESAGLAEATLEQLQASLLKQRNTTQINLFQQANSDVKQLHFDNIHIAIGVIPAGIQKLQQFCENGKLDALVRRCLQHQAAQFLILLHRHSAETHHRAVSLLFYPAPIGFNWDGSSIEFFLQQLQKYFPCRIVYSRSHNKLHDKLPELIQLLQTDQTLTRKGFMPALQRSFAHLLQFLQQTATPHKTLMQGNNFTG